MFLPNTTQILTENKNNETNNESLKVLQHKILKRQHKKKKMNR